MQIVQGCFTDTAMKTIQNLTKQVELLEKDRISFLLELKRLTTGLICLHITNSQARVNQDKFFDAC